MREMKFRAWDKVTKQMLDTGFHILGETNCFQLIEQALIEAQPGVEYSLMRLNDAVITQWTGLKDRNDKDVYESDLISITLNKFNKKYPRCVQVYYIAPSFILGRINHLKPTDNTFLYNMDEFDYEKAIEVVGNIFENPELLK